MSRKHFLYFLLLATLVYRVSSLAEIFSRSTLYSGVRWTIRDNKLAVGSVQTEDPFSQETTAGKAGLREGDRVLRFEHDSGAVLPVRSFVQFCEGIKRVRNELGWSIVVERAAAGGPVTQARLPALAGKTKAGWVEWSFSIFWLTFLPLIATFTAFFIGLSKPEDNHAFVACLLFLSLSTIITATLYLLPPGLLEFTILYEFTFRILLPYLFMRFFLLFPSPSAIDRKAPWIKTLFAAVTGISWLSSFLQAVGYYYSFDFYSRIQWIAGPSANWVNWSSLVMMVLGLASVVLNTFRTQSADERRRMRILLSSVGTGIVLPGILIAFLSLAGTTSVALITAIAVSLATFPAAFAYVVVKHRVLGISLIVRRGLQYLLISRGFWILESVVIFAALYFIARPALIRLLPLAPPLVLTLAIAGFTLALYFALRRLNQPVMRAIDRRFFRQAYDAREILTELSAAVARLAGDPAGLLHLITDRITGSLHPERVAVFLKGYDIEQTEGDGNPKMQKMKSEQYHCVWIQHGAVDEKPQLSQYLFPENAFVPRYVEQMKSPAALEVYLEDPRSWAHAVASGTGTESGMRQERDLLEKLNTRLILPLVSGGHTLGFLTLGEKLSEEPYSREDKNLLLVAAQQAALAIDYAKLISQVADQERMKREMEIARQVQAQLFPQTFPEIPGLTYTGYCRAARGVGGDYYDFLELRDDVLGIALGDISGKGISAALLMAQLQALLRSHAPAHEKKLDLMFPTMNRLMCSSTAKGKYATFFYGVYDASSRSLDYVNAGHLPPMIFRGKEEVLRLKTGGMVMGMVPIAAYKQDRVQLQAGDVLVIYSDGVSEAMNEQEEEFGEERLMSVVRGCLDKSPDEIASRILAGLEQFVNGAPQHDDITLVVARVG